MAFSIVNVIYIGLHILQNQKLRNVKKNYFHKNVVRTSVLNCVLKPNTIRAIYRVRNMV